AAAAPGRDRRGSRTRSGTRACLPSPPAPAAARSSRRAARADAKGRPHRRPALRDVRWRSWRGSLPREQHLARPVQVRLHGVLALLQEPCDLLDRAILEMVQLEELALLLGELGGDRVLQARQALAELVQLER